MYSVDVNDGEDIAVEYNVSTLPRILFFQGGALVADYQGSNEEEISAKYVIIYTPIHKYIHICLPSYFMSTYSVYVSKVCGVAVSDKS